MFTYLKPKTQEELLKMLDDPSIRMSDLEKLAQLDGSVATLAADMYLSQYDMPKTEEEIVLMINDTSTNKIASFLMLRNDIYRSLIDKTSRTISLALLNRLFPELHNNTEDICQTSYQRDLEISNHYVHLPKTEDRRGNYDSNQRS